MMDCKTCKHCTVLYQREREDKFSNAYSPCGYIRCKRPQYKGRAYFCKERQDCPDFERKAKE